MPLLAHAYIHHGCIHMLRATQPWHVLPTVCHIFPVRTCHHRPQSHVPVASWRPCGTLAHSTKPPRMLPGLRSSQRSTVQARYCRCASRACVVGIGCRWRVHDAAAHPCRHRCQPKILPRMLNTEPFVLATHAGPWRVPCWQAAPRRSLLVGRWSRRQHGHKTQYAARGELDDHCQSTIPTKASRQI